MTDIATKETGTLISANKVEGTKVYNAKGDKLGHVDAVMLDKQRGNVAYAVMSFGGFLGMGEKQHPLPWSTLKYDEKQDGYVVNLSKEQLEKAPTFERGAYGRLADPAYGESVYKYYGATPYWY
ncbi:MAG: PRC-barrel domain-containing protein [Pseudomonadota bacterium]|nr:PRC-barrel domain-containing protein [Pseudomonadota bacterium]